MIESNSQDGLVSELPISLNAFIPRLDITDTTAWRWRKQGKLKTTNIAGRLYIMPEDLREFNRRAKNGELPRSTRHPKL